MSRVRVLVVDDSPTMRAFLASLLKRDPGIEVIGSASDAATAREMIKTLDPDVVTLDIEMPGMNGLAFLEKIMTLRPTPVVMVSAATQAGSAAAVEAMRLGAIGCFAKPSDGRGASMERELPALLDLIREAAASKVAPAPMGRDEAPIADFRWNGMLVAIGASTGGVEAIYEVVRNFPAECPPTVIVQHMPPTFTASLAARLDRLIAPKVVEAADGMPLQQGCIYIAPGGDRHMEVSCWPRGRVRLVPGPLVSGHQPSVDALFQSVARAAGPTLGVILTGMGADGAEGLLAMREHGARTLGQDETSCVVYGMPRAAKAIGAVEREMPLSRLGSAIIELAGAPLAQAAPPPRFFQGALHASR
jgi:two-component system chemotaxis response regulator CheB